MSDVPWESESGGAVPMYWLQSASYGEICTGP